MKLNKCLKMFSIILECSVIGSIIIYIYNYFVSSKKYDVMPIEIKTRLNTFIIIAVVSLILFLIIKYVLYMINKPQKENIQLEMELKEEREKQYRNLEAPITERVFIYKNEYEVPKERQEICKNCGNVVDKNAFICVKCGCLLKEMPKERIVERVVKQEIKPIKKKDNTEVINILINTGLIIAIIIFVILIINLAIERGII